MLVYAACMACMNSQALQQQFDARMRAVAKDGLFASGAAATTQPVTPDLCTVATGLSSLVQEYLPESGVRSPILRVGAADVKWDIGCFDETSASRLGTVSDQSLARLKGSILTAARLGLLPDTICREDLQTFLRQLFGPQLHANKRCMWR